MKTTDFKQRIKIEFTPLKDNSLVESKLMQLLPLMAKKLNEDAVTQRYKSNEISVHGKNIIITLEIETSVMLSWTTHAVAQRYQDFINSFLGNFFAYVALKIESSNVQLPKRVM